MKINIYKTENQTKTHWKFTLKEPRRDSCGKKRKMFVHEMEVQWRWPEQSGQRRESLVAAQHWWKKKRVSRGGRGTPEQLQRERDDWPEQCGRRRDATAIAQWWQHNKGARVVVSLKVAERERGDSDDGSTTVAAQEGELAWWSRRKLQREMEETVRARKKGVRVFEP